MEGMVEVYKGETTWLRDKPHLTSVINSVSKGISSLAISVTSHYRRLPFFFFFFKVINKFRFHFRDQT